MASAAHVQQEPRSAVSVLTSEIIDECLRGAAATVKEVEQQFAAALREAMR